MNRRYATTKSRKAKLSIEKSTLRNLEPISPSQLKDVAGGTAVGCKTMNPYSTRCAGSA